MKKENLSTSMPRLIMSVTLIVCIGALLGVAGYVLTKQKCAVQNPPVAQKADETADWKTYRNEEANFTFKYPIDWEITQDYFYETLSGIKATKRTVNLKKIGEDEWISINQRQFLCDQGKCEMIAGNEIATYSKKSETLGVFDEIVKSFEMIDEAADWQTYTNENGFEISYPLDWKIYGTNIDSSVNIMSYDLFDPKFERGNADGVKIQIQTESFNQIMSLDKFVPIKDDLTGKAVVTEKLIMNSYEVHKASMNGAVVYFLMSSDGKMGIRIFAWKGGNENLNNIADQILSTFKFTEK